jgi:hypothetical protein
MTFALWMMRVICFLGRLYGMKGEPLVSALPIVVRPLETAAERDALYLEASRAFNPDLSEAERVSNIAGRRQRAESAPDYDPTLLRGAFRGDTFLGGYRIQERRLQLGAARLLTCCIGSVVTTS